MYSSPPLNVSNVKANDSDVGVSSPVKDLANCFLGDDNLPSIQCV